MRVQSQGSGAGPLQGQGTGHTMEDTRRNKEGMKIQVEMHLVKQAARKAKEKRFLEAAKRAEVRERRRERWVKKRMAGEEGGGEEERAGWRVWLRRVSLSSLGEGKGDRG